MSGDFFDNNGFGTAQNDDNFFVQPENLKSGKTINS